MKLRPPSVPLITIDPYFSVWSPADRLTDKATVHWSGKPNTMRGSAFIDDVEYRFMGDGNAPAMKQILRDADAFSTTYVFEAAGIRLQTVFTSPVLPDDLYLLSRPVSYLELSAKSIDGAKHRVNIKLSVSEEICLNLKGEDEVVCETLTLANDIKSVKMGSVKQPVLGRDGDDLRIDYGYFYLSVKDGKVGSEKCEDMTFVNAEVPLLGEEGVLFTFAYDDIKSIAYFGTHLPSYWNRNGERITDEIVKAHEDYQSVSTRCREFSDRLFIDAVRAGGEQYAELLLLAMRQVNAAHKVAIDPDGNVLFISKECFSNGCAATVDVTYPSIPIYLLYNTELIKGMLRPIYKYARSEEWPHDFAPHDAGRYPVLDGQRYHGTDINYQMPVEECGNMLIIEAAMAVRDRNADFAMQNIDLLEQWATYLVKHGPDPDNQLCTDDFAGHLAHNCNLSLKAIMGIAGLAIIYEISGNKTKAVEYLRLAREMAKDWTVRAHNGDGSYKLAFDREGTFSMKYNIVWDKLFGTQVMAKEVIASEVASYFRHMRPYGLPLDNRSTYTKSDWLVWIATLANDREDFERFIEPLWKAYHFSPSRVPMTDWYFTDTSVQRGFQNRTVQGGLFIKLLEYYGFMQYPEIDALAKRSLQKEN